MTDPRLARLRRMAPYRRRRERDCTISDLVDSTRKAASRTQARAGAFVETWERLVPAPLSGACRLGQMRGGSITILVESSSVKYELDGLLRSGLEARLRQEYDGPLTRVRTRLVAAEPDAES